MSLKVWLPLNGDIKNLGTSPEIFTGSPSFTNGKIGQCMVCPGTAVASRTTLPSQLTKNNIYSLCCWAKMVDTSGESGWLMTLGNGTGTTRGLWLSTNTIQWAYSGSGENFSTSIHPGDGEWHHIATTIDGSTAKLYIDGQYMSSITPSSLEQITGTNIQIGTASRSFHINDARIYDHCLSAAEVHEISQGLILHYKLNKPNPNLIRYGGPQTNATTGWNPRTGTVLSVVSCEQAPFGYAIHGDWSLSNNLGIHHQPQNYNLLENGVTYTFSGWARASRPRRAYWHNEYMINNNYVNLTTEWQFFSFTSSIDTSKTTHSNICYPTDTSQEGDWIEVFGWKLEKSNVATRWIPFKEEKEYQLFMDDATKIQDSSGYNRNGIAFNEPISMKGFRYTSGLQFNGSNQYVNCGQGAKVTDAITIAVWAYMDDWSTYNARTFSCTNSGGWYLGRNGDRPSFLIGFGENSNTYTRVNASIPYSQLSSGWHHFAVTYDGYYTKIYIDGELSATGTTVQSVKTPIFYDNNNFVILGGEAGVADLPENGYYFNGVLSDFRIYCTALLDNDIKLLYNTNMRIDNFNNVHIYEIDENNYLGSKLLKTGILKGKTFIENCMAEMPDGNSISFTPKANTDNINSTTLGILFPYFKHCGHKLRATIELDATWTKFTAGTGGTFALYFQGPRVNIETDAVEWAGQAMITNSLPKLTSKVLESAGSEHIKVTTDINASFFDTHYGQKIGLRCNFSDGTGHIDISNIKVYIDYPSAKIHSKYIAENNIIEM